MSECWLSWGASSPVKNYCLAEVLVQLCLGCLVSPLKIYHSRLKFCCLRSIMYGDDLLKVKVLGFLGFEVEVWHGDEKGVDSVFG